MINEYVSLSTRLGFNKSLGHFRLVTGVVDQLNRGLNLADVIDDLEKQKAVEKAQIGPILNALVRDRLDYSALSFNLARDVDSFDTIRETTEKWNRVDVLLAYHHPQLGITLINPKQSGQWETVQELNREELVVCYAKALRENERDLDSIALEALQALLSDRPPNGVDELHDPVGITRPAPPPPPPTAKARAATPIAPPPAASPTPPQDAQPEAAPPKPAAAGGKRRVTPKYSIQVTNELFHNGNVEAWKNIVASYNAKFPDLEVHIFHDGQKVNNINALFKWGKVKNGDVILFSVAGDEIKGVAKLQRYLFEGASLRFQQFLKKDVNKTLNLF